MKSWGLAASWWWNLGSIHPKGSLTLRSISDSCWRLETRGKQLCIGKTCIYLWYVYVNGSSWCCSGGIIFSFQDGRWQELIHNVVSILIIFPCFVSLTIWICDEGNDALEKISRLITSYTCYQISVAIRDCTTHSWPSVFDEKTGASNSISVLYDWIILELISPYTESLTLWRICVFFCVSVCDSPFPVPYGLRQ